MSNNGLQQDPYLTLLKSELEKERAAGNTLSPRFERTAGLFALHVNDKKGGFEAWKASLFAGRLGIPAPIGAIDVLENAERIALNDLDEKGGQKIGIDTLLGFKGQGKGGGRNSPVQTSLQENLRETLCHSVRLLVATGVPLVTACKEVARKLKTIPKLPSEYRLKYPNAETLRKMYSKWEKDRGEDVLSCYDQGFALVPREIMEKMRDKFLL
jgi:hypothetical protein